MTYEKARYLEKKYGSPLYLFQRSKLRERCDIIKYNKPHMLSSVVNNALSSIYDAETSA